MAALILFLTLSTLSAAAAASHPFTASTITPKLTKAVNYKGYTTYNVESKLAEQFTSVQHCLPIQLILLETTTGVLDHAVVAVNSTSLDGSYSIHPYVEKKQLVRSQAPIVCFFILLLSDPIAVEGILCLTSPPHP